MTVTAAEKEHHVSQTLRSLASLVQEAKSAVLNDAEGTDTDDDDDGSSCETSDEAVVIQENNLTICDKIDFDVRCLLELSPTLRRQIVIYERSMPNAPPPHAAQFFISDSTNSSLPRQVFPEKPFLFEPSKISPGPLLTLSPDRHSERSTSEYHAAGALAQSVRPETWTIYRTILTKLYIEGSQTLKDVIHYMEQTYGFRATTAQYRRHFKSWGLKKNLKQQEMAAVVVKTKSRKEQGKDGVANVLGRQIQPKQDREDLQSEMVIPDLDLLPNAVCHTPPHASDSTSLDSSTHEGEEDLAREEAREEAGEETKEGEGERERESGEEPRYCYCNDISYGEMVSCDGGYCEREWFHLHCVGLTQSPARTGKFPYRSRAN